MPGTTALGVIYNIGAAIMLSIANKIITEAVTDNTTNRKKTDYGIMANQSSDQAVIPLRYGICRGGINQVYASSRGSDLKFMDMIAVLGEGQIQGIVREDGTIYTTIGTNFPTSNPPLVYVNKELWTKQANYIFIQFFNGSDSQGVCPALAGFDTDFTQAMRRTAYLFITLIYDKEAFNQLPNITVTTAGLKVYNPVTSAWAYSNNAALCALDYMTRPSTRGGMGLSMDTVDIQSVSDAIDYCDAKEWTCNQILNESKPAADILQTLLDNFRGRIPPSNTGNFRMLFRDLNYEATVMDLTEDDILDGSFSMGQPDVLSRPNAIRMEYYPSAEPHNYQIKDHVFTDDVALASDGDYREITRGPFGYSTLGLVQNMAYYLLERERNGKTVTLIGGRRTLGLEPEDLVTLTHRVPGWTQRILRVVAVDPDLVNFRNTIQLKEESTEFYDSNYDHVIEDLFETSLPDPTATVESVTNVNHYETVYNYRGRSETRWMIEFDPPDESVYPWFDYAEIWVKIDDGEFVYKTTSERDYFIQPAQEGATYTVRIVSVSIFGKKQSTNAAISVKKTIVGKTEDPTNLTYVTAVANGDTVNIYSDEVNDPDIDGYEVRMGDSFLGGIFVSYHKSPTVKLVGVRPGTHTFWMSPVRLSTTGLKLYSAAPVSASVTVFIPPGYASVDTEPWDFDGIGTHNNTEYILYDSDDSVKCSHTSDVLTGTWTSPTWDLTSVQKVKIWADFETAFVSSANTVEGIASTTLTTEDLGGDTLSVSEIIGAVQAGNVSIEMSYSEDNAEYKDIQFFELMAAEVNARYIYITVTITDPTLDSQMYCKTITMNAYSGPQ